MGRPQKAIDAGQGEQEPKLTLKQRAEVKTTYLDYRPRPFPHLRERAFCFGYSHGTPYQTHA